MCNVEIEFLRAGLNKGDEVRYGIMENSDKPGTYQWEAVSDDAAQKIITNAIKPYIEEESFTLVEQHELIITNRFKKNWQQFVENFSQGD